jgi:hypothetical protein
MSRPSPGKKRHLALARSPATASHMWLDTCLIVCQVFLQRGDTRRCPLDFVSRAHFTLGRMVTRARRSMLAHPPTPQITGNFAEKIATSRCRIAAAPVLPSGSTHEPGLDRVDAYFHDTRGKSINIGTSRSSACIITSSCLI